jgi:hypothetical protein
LYLRLSLLKANFDDIWWVFLHTKLAYSAHKSFVHRHTYFIRPVTQYLWNRVVTERVRYELNNLVFNVVHKLYLIWFFSSLFNQDFNHTKSISIDAKLIYIIKNFVKYKLSVSHLLAQKNFLNYMSALLVLKCYRQFVLP